MGSGTASRWRAEHGTRGTLLGGAHGTVVRVDGSFDALASFPTIYVVSGDGVESALRFRLWPR